MEVSWWDVLYMHHMERATLCSIRNHRISAHSQRWASVTMGKFEKGCGTAVFKKLRNNDWTTSRRQRFPLSRCFSILSTNVCACVRPHAFVWASVWAKKSVFVYVSVLCPTLSMSVFAFVCRCPSVFLRVCTTGLHVCPLVSIHICCHKGKVIRLPNHSMQLPTVNEFRQKLLHLQNRQLPIVNLHYPEVLKFVDKLLLIVNKHYEYCQNVLYSAEFKNST
jgi:hypothetical protein